MGEKLKEYQNVHYGENIVADSPRAKELARVVRTDLKDESPNAIGHMLSAFRVWIFLLSILFQMVKGAKHRHCGKENFMKWHWYDQYWESVDCENEEQVEWLQEKLNEGDPGVVKVEGNTVVIHSVFTHWEDDSVGEFDLVAEAIAEFQEHFKIDTPWVGSYGIICTDHNQCKSYSGAVVIHRGKIQRIEATKLAIAKAAAAKTLGTRHGKRTPPKQRKGKK